MNTENVRSYIRSVMSQNKAVSAGFVVVKEFDTELRVLGLRRFSRYDLPKGHVESGEDLLTTAIRETAEEASVTDLNMQWGNESFEIKTPRKNIILFLAKTEQDGEIARNPETGKWEHHGTKWMTFDEALSADFGFLGPAIKWAHNKINNHSVDVE